MRNTPREFHNVMHALQLQGAPQVFGRGFGGELYAAAGPLQNNNAAPAVAGVLAFLEQAAARIAPLQSDGSGGFPDRLRGPFGY